MIAGKQSKRRGNLLVTSAEYARVHKQAYPNRSQPTNESWIRKRCTSALLQLREHTYTYIILIVL